MLLGREHVRTSDLVHNWVIDGRGLVSEVSSTRVIILVDSVAGAIVSRLSIRVVSVVLAGGNDGVAEVSIQDDLSSLQWAGAVAVRQLDPAGANAGVGLRGGLGNTLSETRLARVKIDG